MVILYKVDLINFINIKIFKSTLNYNGFSFLLRIVAWMEGCYMHTTSSYILEYCVLRALGGQGDIYTLKTIQYDL